MKKTRDKTNNQPESQPSRGDSAETAEAGRRSINTSVDWEIPGDVPEEHRRSVTPYAPVAKPEPGAKISESRASTATTGAVAGEQARSTVPGQAGAEPNRESSYPLRGLLVLLLMLGLVGLGYLVLPGNEETPVVVAVEQTDMVEESSLQKAPEVMQTVLNDAAQEVANPAENDVRPEVMDKAEEVIKVAQEPRVITHVVKKGDTLWDIAGYYVDDPFRYPELAKLSQIENPHLIYPGDIVRIRV